MARRSFRGDLREACRESYVQMVKETVAECIAFFHITVRVQVVQG